MSCLKGGTSSAVLCEKFQLSHQILQIVPHAKHNCEFGEVALVTVTACGTCHSDRVRHCRRSRFSSSRVQKGEIYGCTSCIRGKFDCEDKVDRGYRRRAAGQLSICMHAYGCQGFDIKLTAGTCDASLISSSRESVPLPHSIYVASSIDLRGSPRQPDEPPQSRTLARYIDHQVRKPYNPGRT